jgi:zinc/manganese transport system substrate-binding protein/manganese/iron transport system substrate-binding protein
LVAVSCGGDDDGDGGGDTGDGHVRAITSLELFADMVRNVGGDRVDVDALLPSGADPHTFELSPGKAADIARADVVFINGLELEHSIEDVIDNSAEGPVIELAAGLPVVEDTQQYTEEEEEEGDHEGEEHSAGNPHMWLDARLAARYVERIRDTLIDIDPEGRAAYEANATAYLEQLGDLDREIEEAVLAIPEANRKLVTFHDAYVYLAARYGLEIVGVVVPSPGQEPSAQAVADLVRTLDDEGIPAVYKEPQFNAEVLERAASEAGVRVLDLLSDAYGDGVDSYIGLMEFNIAQLTEGLGGG